jgi:putative membrane protein insertion efficiency factor
MVEKIAKFFIKVYQMLVSPLLPSSTCRYYPTCSIYMHQSIEKYGVLRGVGKGLARIGRCNPWSKCDHIDLP